MPCNMMDGCAPPSGMDHQERKAFESLTQRIAELEQALCGLCQMIDTDADEIPMHPQLQAWFEKHKAKPGCDAR